MGLGLYGKHPGRGDFLDHGLPAPLQRALETWLDGALAEARAELGPAWEGVWAHAPVLRFWLGEAIWGHTVCGVMAPSADRVGRRFPLVFLFVAPDGAGALPPPVTDPDQGWYDQAEAALRAALADPAPGPGGAMLTGLRPPQGDGQAGDAGFWARRDEGGPVDLWADVAQTDHRRAAAGRSYWWVALTAEKAPPDPESWDTDDAPPEETGADEDAVDTEDQGADEGAETGENGSVPAENDPDTGEADAPEPPGETGADTNGETDDADDPFTADLPEEEDSPFGAPSEGSNGLLAQASAWASDAMETAGSPWDDPAPAQPAPQPAPVSHPAPALHPGPAPAPQPAPEGPRLYAGPGLPEGAVLGWLLGGGA